jgi:hypothetical protein
MDGEAAIQASGLVGRHCQFGSLISADALTKRRLSARIRKIAAWLSLCQSRQLAVARLTSQMLILQGFVA